MALKICLDTVCNMDTDTYISQLNEAVLLRAAKNEKKIILVIT